MKPVFKCDYCSHIGTEEEIKVHEINCTRNYDMKSCFTCIHRKMAGVKDMKMKYDCKAGKDIPEGKIYQNCELYEQDDIKKYSDFGNVFSSLFGTV